MRKIRLFQILAVSLVFAMGSGCSRHAATGPQKTQITIDQAAKTLVYLPLYVAIEKGYFADQGIEANIVTAGGDSQAFAALASGQAQFAQGDPAFVAISHEQGGPGIVIASVLDRVAFYGVTFKNDIHPFSDPKGFKGLTVVTYPEPNTAFVVQKNLLQRAGLRLGKDSSIAQAAFGTELGPLNAGRAQIAVSIEPTVSQAESQGAHVVFSYPDAWGPFLLTGVMTTEAYASKNPQSVRGVVTAYDKALQLIHNDPAAAIAIGQKYFPEVPEASIRTAIARLTHDHVFPEHAAVSLDSWKATIELRKQVGDLKSTDHDNLVDNSFSPASQPTTK